MNSKPMATQTLTFQKAPEVFLVSSLKTVLFNFTCLEELDPHSFYCPEEMSVNVLKNSVHKKAILLSILKGFRAAELMAK